MDVGCGFGADDRRAHARLYKPIEHSNLARPGGADISNYYAITRSLDHPRDLGALPFRSLPFVLSSSMFRLFRRQSSVVPLTIKDFRTDQPLPIKFSLRSGTSKEVIVAISHLTSRRKILTRETSRVLPRSPFIPELYRHTTLPLSAGKRIRGHTHQAGHTMPSSASLLSTSFYILCGHN